MNYFPLQHHVFYKNNKGAVGNLTLQVDERDSRESLVGQIIEELKKVLVKNAVILRSDPDTQHFAQGANFDCLVQCGKEKFKFSCNIESVVVVRFRETKRSECVETQCTEQEFFADSAS